MKKVLSTILALCLMMPALAQLNGDGYYRIRNVGSGRYINVTDNKGSVNISSTSADLGAVKLIKSFESIVSDPGSILYIKNVNGQYRFKSQGTDTHEIIGYDLKIKAKGSAYLAYQEQSLMAMYLCDARLEDTELGVLSTKSSNNTYREWSIISVSCEGEQYFGLNPEQQYNGSYYTTFYASFPFSFASSGMKAYYISLVENGKAVYSEVADGKVPASMPVFIQSSATGAVNNKLDIADNSAKMPTDNKLGGVYFHNTSKSHKNLTAYDSETMRILGITSSGKLGFVKADIDYLPANKAYLNVPAGTPDEVELMSQTEYDAYLAEINRKVEVAVTASNGGTVIGGGEYKVNTQVTVTATPAEGYRFAGWSNGVTANPYTFTATENISLQATFALNSYRLTYVVDGLQYSSQFVDYGTALTAPTVPAKEGYTFSGWSEVPATMPAKDLTITGSYSVNSYTLTYLVDGAVYATETVAYGTALTLKEAPVKEGYIFSGWSELPATMPAHDVTVSGQFASGISSVLTDDSLVDVYSVLGVRVKAQMPLKNLKAELPRGIYIVNGRKVVIK